MMEKIKELEGGLVWINSVGVIDTTVLLKLQWRDADLYQSNN